MTHPDYSGVRLRPNDTIGILGGGQLGRMLALAAASLGLRTHIFCPDRRCPAFQVADSTSCAAYDDEEALARFCDSVAAVTYEFENIPAATVDYVAARRPLRPTARALEVSQDRLTEKQFLNRIGIRTAPYRAIDSERELAQAGEALGFPCVAKTRRFGYDGKGQTILRGPADVAGAWGRLGTHRSILEAFIPFDCEISVTAARALDGDIRTYPVTRNDHENHILSRSRVPAQVPTTVAQSAVAAARKLTEALDYVGVLAVEFFVSGTQLLANEFAPRVHNSGHWTMEGAATDHFRQHIRAVAGWPLGDVGLRGHRIEMKNLIGSDVHDWDALLKDPAAHLHLYGKQDAQPGRKMGHVTWVTAEPE